MIIDPHEKSGSLLHFWLGGLNNKTAAASVQILYGCPYRLPKLPGSVVGHRQFLIWLHSVHCYVLIVILLVHKYSKVAFSYKNIQF
jgi:hypothetical protein